MAKVQITEAQMSAFECAGVFECPEDEPVSEFITGNHIAVTERSRELVNELSNHLDECAQHDTDADRRKWCAKDARVLSNLLIKMIRAEAPCQA